MKNLKDIDSKNDSYSEASKDRLLKSVEYRMKEIYKNALDCIELAYGKDAEGYETIRSKILGEGNDQVRRIKEEISERYNIEFIPQTIKFTIAKDNDSERENNGNS